MNATQSTAGPGRFVTPVSEYGDLAFVSAQPPAVMANWPFAAKSEPR